MTRRSLLQLAAAAPLAPSLKAANIPVGLELFSVRNELRADLFGTVRAVAKMGYECVEFFSPYFEWTPAYAKDVRKLLDDLGVKCHSTHNSPRSFEGDGMDKAIELNQILGSRVIVMASAGRVESLDGWKRVAERLDAATGKMQPAGIRPGYHNHKLEFVPLEGARPMEILARTGKAVMLQLDVGTCVEAGADPVAWIERNPGRIGSIHCKDWSAAAGKGYRVLFGAGDSPWKKIFQAAEATGGVEFYLVEQEGADTPPFETAQRCLAEFRKIHG